MPNTAHRPRLSGGVRRAAASALIVAAGLVLAACADQAGANFISPTPVPTRPALPTVAPEHADAGICSRTPQVREGILWRIEGVDHCALATHAHLAGIGGMLDLSWWNIARLQPGDFAGLAAVTSLDLRHNPLTVLEPGIFDGLASLRGIDLSGNELTSLEPGIFDGLAALGWIHLRSNSLTSLEVGVFDGLTSLTFLDLRDNMLTSTEAGVFDELPSLEDLWLPTGDDDGGGVGTAVWAVIAVVGVVALAAGGWARVQAAGRLVRVVARRRRARSASGGSKASITARR